ncbi:hypothetical protein D3OALGB2SA_3384 [Olavius algarvensis associated proteobacterium Delta 3]|nr:hypothetical protein D3OALGB2SA_3384 [Olavius algarvensis associated proteobacterium Delta 3]
MKFPAENYGGLTRNCVMLPPLFTASTRLKASQVTSEDALEAARYPGGGIAEALQHATGFTQC